VGVSAVGGDKGGLVCFLGVVGEAGVGEEGWGEERGGGAEGGR